MGPHVAMRGVPRGEGLPSVQKQARRGTGYERFSNSCRRSRKGCRDRAMVMDMEGAWMGMTMRSASARRGVGAGGQTCCNTKLQQEAVGTPRGGRRSHES